MKKLVGYIAIFLFIITLSFLLLKNIKAAPAEVVLKINVNDGIFINGTGTVRSNPAGIECGLPGYNEERCTEAFPLGTTVTLEVIPSTGNIFTDWHGTSGCPIFTGGNEQGVTYYDVTMTKDEECSAYFVAQSFPPPPPPPNMDDFILSVEPATNALNPGWIKDYSTTIIPTKVTVPVELQGLSVDFEKRNDVEISWPYGNTIPLGESGPKIMRVQALDPPTESRRGFNYNLAVVAFGRGITKDKKVDFYINQRPNARDKARGNTNINVGGFVKIYDDGSSDPDTLAPGNALTAVIADFNNDATLDFNGNLIGIDKCFIVGDTTGNTCNVLWPGSASPNPASNDWKFTYNKVGAYSIRYFVFDDLIADAQAVNWTERFKSAGMATPIPVIVGPAPSQAPTAVIEIQNDNGMPIDEALPNQLFYAYVGKSSDSDGTIKQVSFCVDTTPESGSVKICDGNWIFPYFYWDTPDFARGWLAVAKKLEKRISQPGTYAIYTVVSDNTGMVSKVAMDIITIVNPPPPTADDQSVTTNEDTPVGITLSGLPQSNLTYIVDSLPANGALKTSAGRLITSVPFTLPDTIVTYAPKLNFASPPTDPFKFKVNDGFLDSLLATVSLTVNPVNDPPIAVFTVSPLSGQAGVTIFNVDASNSYDVENAVNLQVRWDWENDGVWDTSFSSVKTASHIYATAESKTIRLEVKDSGELTGTSTKTVDVFSPAPYNISVTNPGAAGKITSTSTQAGATNFDCGNGGSICGPIVYNGGEAITFTAIPNAGQKYLAGTWGGVCAGPTSVDCVLTVRADATISAVFTSPRALSVSVIGTGAGSVTSSPGIINCPGVCADTYTNGTVVTLTAAPVNSTVAWIGCDSVLGLTCTTAMTSDKAVTATFTPNPPLSPSDIAGLPTCVDSNKAAVDLSWTDNAINEDGFSIYRDTKTDFTSPDLAIIGVGPNTGVNPALTGLVSYRDITPNVSTIYYYKVRAFNTGGNSAFSLAIKITTDSCAPTFKIFDSSGDTTASINMGDTEQYAATYDADGPGGPARETTVTSSAEWTSSLPSVATINPNGLAKGVAAGTATIIGSYNSLSATASLEVRGDIRASFTALPSLFIKSPYKSTLSATILPPYIGNGLYTYAFNCGNGQVTSNTTSDTTDSYTCMYTIPPRNYTASVIITRAGTNQFSDSKTIGIKPPLPTFKEKIPK